MLWDNAAQTESLISLDTASGNYTTINTLPLLDPVATATPFSQNRFTTFDSNHHHYILRAKDEDGYPRLYTIATDTGTVLQNPLFPQLSDSQDGIYEMQYDNSTDTLYGVYIDISESKFYVVTINQQTGQHTILWQIPNIYSIDSSMGYSGYNELNHSYTFRALGDNGWRLFSINTDNGSMVSQPFFPVLNNAQDNIIELQYDNESGMLYGLHWNANSLSTIASGLGSSCISPNPITRNAIYQLGKIYQNLNLRIVNLMGQVVCSKTFYDTSEIEIDRANYASGIYHLELFSDGNLLDSKKIIFE